MHMSGGRFGSYGTGLLWLNAPTERVACGFIPKNQQLHVNRTVVWSLTLNNIRYASLLCPSSTVRLLVHLR
jgi:hypothetical protein